MAVQDLSSEFEFQASRSGGAGGQNVNKVNTKIELRFHVGNSVLLTEQQKQKIMEKLGNRITQEGYLQLVCQAERSQLQNKEHCIKKLYELIEQALAPEKKRKATKPTRESVRKRLQAKKKQSDKKAARGNVDW
ncbi:MAG: aminoacyl-tRNA hydrolase [Hymenobacteraceae bacterium]|nr:aminoacyl-tRNA hydrolase [Hymenobacteraceae bacterium]MDX5397985.1 aminoacyl-tRNA hydrolase [Hymenobacteraceae bacterium]MDX5514057.1 aminoacyl-tRNA hydrolase [Hymenobacteraceae bacterium]